MDNISKSESTINKLYDDLSYFDLYGGSVFLSIILIIILFLVCSYFYIMKNTQPIKNDWAAQRCHPYVMPFAGIINKPDDKTAFEFTQENMSYCVQNILTSVTGYLVEPITYSTSALNSVYSDLINVLQDLRNVMSNVRTYISDIAKEILGRIANVMIPLQSILLKFRDSMGKMKAIMVTGLYTAIGTFVTFKSFIGTIIQLVTEFLIIFAGIIVALWITGFFFAPAAISAAALTVFMVILVALTVPVISFMKSHLGISPASSIPSIPSKPSCFDKNMLLKMQDYSFKKMVDIEVGDILFNNNKVTAKMKLDATNTEMFELPGGVIVSGCHRVICDGKWIYVKNYPDAKHVCNYSDPFIYCLNTESKRIVIDALEFCDWDEIFEKEVSELLDTTNKETEYIHKRYDNGFVGTTQIELDNGSVKEIQNICVNDVLKENIKVYGTVEIYAEDLGEQDKKDKIDYLVKIYHLLTEKDYFIVHDKKQFDYNSCIEIFLESFKKKYFI